MALYGPATYYTLVNTKRHTDADTDADTDTDTQPKEYTQHGIIKRTGNRVFKERHRA